MSTNEEQKSVNLKEFAAMAGFSEELVRKELFGDLDSSRDISIEDLREAMLNYLDSTMMEN